MARQVFDMIDVDESGYLDKDEIIDAVPTVWKSTSVSGAPDNSVERRDRHSPRSSEEPGRHAVVASMAWSTNS